MWNAISPGFELVSLYPIPATITITPRALFLDHTHCSNYYNTGDISFSISISRCLYLLIYYTLWQISDYLLTLTYQLEGIFLLYFLITISGLLFFIFLSVKLAKYQRIVAYLVSVIGSCWCSYHFSDFSFSYYLLSLKYNLILWKTTRRVIIYGKCHVLLRCYNEIASKMPADKWKEIGNMFFTNDEN